MPFLKLKPIVMVLHNFMPHGYHAQILEVHPAKYGSDVQNPKIHHTVCITVDNRTQVLNGVSPVQISYSNKLGNCI